MTLYFNRSVFAFIIAGLAKPSVAENRKKRRQLDKLSFKEKDDKKRLLHDHFVSDKDKVKELHPRMTAMKETEDLANSERNPRHVGLVVNTERDSDRFHAGIFDASSRGKLVVSDDVPQNSRRIEAEDTCRVAGGDECGDGHECICECDEPNAMKPTPKPTPVPTPSACEMECTVDTLAELKVAIESAPEIPQPQGLISVCNGTFFFDEPIYLSYKAFEMCCPGPEECIFDGSLVSTGNLFGTEDPVNFTMKGFTFQNGSTYFGGALSLYNVAGNAELINNTFRGNYATVEGGALDLSGSHLNVLLEGNVFEYNRAGMNGGAVFSSLSTSVVFKNNIFINNTAQNGGALSLRFETSTLEGNTFENNTAAKYGDNIFGLEAPVMCTSTNNFCDGDSVPSSIQTTCGATRPVCP